MSKVGCVEAPQSLTFTINGRTVKIPWGYKCVLFILNCKKFATGNKVNDQLTFDVPDVDDSIIDLFLRIAQSENDFSEVPQVADEGSLALRTRLRQLAESLEFRALLEYLDRESRRVDSWLNNQDTVVANFAEIVKNGFSVQLFRRYDAKTMSGILDRVREANPEEFQAVEIQKELVKALMERMREDRSFRNLLHHFDMSASFESLEEMLTIPGVLDDYKGDDSLTVMDYMDRVEARLDDFQIDRELMRNVDEAVKRELDVMKQDIEMKDNGEKAKGSLVVMNEENKKLTQAIEDLRDEVDKDSSAIRKLQDSVHKLVTEFQEELNNASGETVIVDLKATPQPLLLNSDIEFDAYTVLHNNDLEELGSDPALKKLLQGDCRTVWSLDPEIWSKDFPAFVIDFRDKSVVVQCYVISCPDRLSFPTDWVLLGRSNSDEKWEELHRMKNNTLLESGAAVPFYCSTVMKCHEIKFALTGSNWFGVRRIVLQSFELFGVIESA